uniref:Matrix protein n=1 Tax=Coturnix japonica TaxID=93934 RepID=A0A8C2YCZ6_COTJA
MLVPVGTRPARSAPSSRRPDSALALRAARSAHVPPPTAAVLGPPGTENGAESFPDSCRVSGGALSARTYRGGRRAAMLRCALLPAVPLSDARSWSRAARAAPLLSASRPLRYGPQRRVVVVRITNPLRGFAPASTTCLIRLYFDSEFSIEEFTRGAKQAFSVVLQMLKEKISSLSENHRDAFSGRKFVSILMRFWYLNGANLPDEVPGETKVFQIVFGDENTKEKRHILTANYEFQREFTEGAKPDWTITRIEHPKLLE